MTVPGSMEYTLVFSGLFVTWVAISLPHTRHVSDKKDLLDLLMEKSLRGSSCRRLHSARHLQISCPILRACSKH